MVVRLVLIMFVAALTAFSQQMPPIEPGVSHELAKWRAARYSDVRYKLNLTLEKMSPVLKGTMEIRIQHTYQDCTECPPLAIILDWRKIKGSESLSTILNVTINERSATLLPTGEISKGSGSMRVLDANGIELPPKTAVRYEERDEHLIFQEGVVMGENVIKLDFTSPILTSGSAITRYVDKEDGAEYIYSLFVPSDASTAFPVFDQPDLKARFTLGFGDPPNGWKIVSNTGPFHIAADGMEPFNDIWSFPETKPISTYVFAFAAGPFTEFPSKGTQRIDVAKVLRDMAESGELEKSNFTFTPVKPKEINESVPPAVAGGALSPGAKTPPATAGGTDSTVDVATSIYVRKSQAAKFKPHAAEVFRLNREGIKFLESYFDYKFPFPKYDVVLIPEFPFGGMEHAGATFLRESSVIFPQEPTKNDYISRANVIFHEAAHQWFGDTVTMKWFDDLWLKEGFAEFMAYKTLEKVMPEYNAWKVFYERNKQAAYLTDSTKGTTPIYQEIANLNSAKSAYGNIVYRKAPSFLRQAEFYLGPDKFQTAVRAFLMKHEYANAGWEDLVKEFEMAKGQNLTTWATAWVKNAGVPVVRVDRVFDPDATRTFINLENRNNAKSSFVAINILKVLTKKGTREETRDVSGILLTNEKQEVDLSGTMIASMPHMIALFPNYQDYGYGIFLLDPTSRDYVLKNIGGEKDDFLRTMMWGSLWDSVREGELDPKEYVELVVKNLKLETDESTIQTLLGRVSTAMRYYLSEPPALAGGTQGHKPARKQGRSTQSEQNALPNGRAYATDLQTRVEMLLIDRMQNAATPGQKITYYRSFLNIASSENARRIMKEILKKSAAAGSVPPAVAGGAMAPGKKSVDQPKRTPPATAGGTDPNRALAGSTKDRFDIVSKLIILGDPEAPKLLADLEKSERSDEAKRYAYAARAGFATAENKAKFWNDFVANKDLSESWIEAAFVPFNNVRHSELTLPYLEKALAELPNLKRNRKIFFVNGWLGAFIGGQKSEQALAIVNKFLADNPGLDKDLRLKILENVDVIERAVKIRAKYGKRGE